MLQILIKKQLSISFVQYKFKLYIKKINDVGFYGSNQTGQLETIEHKIESQQFRVDCANIS